MAELVKGLSEETKGKITIALDRQKVVRLTIAQALVKYLQVQYSERDGKRRRFIPALFGIFGHGNVAGLGQALVENGQDLPYYQPFNEQSMVHTAAGFAKANARLATLACASSIGPGATNMITGAAVATINRLPVLLLPSDYYVTRHQGPVLQQLEHPISADVSVNDSFRPVSRFFDRISRPEQLLTALPEAMRVLTDPAETGAVTLALPQDTQAHCYDYPAFFFEERVWRVERRVPDSRRIEEAVALLKQAKQPVIIAGGGVHYSEAWDELQMFSESFGIPVGETFGGKGAIRKASTLLLGGHGVTGTPAAGKIVSQADLVISVGTRLTDFTTGSQSVFNHPEVKFININVCGHDAYKQGALPITADARASALPSYQGGPGSGDQAYPFVFGQYCYGQTRVEPRSCGRGLPTRPWRSHGPRRADQCPQRRSTGWRHHCGSIRQPSGRFAQALGCQRRPGLSARIWLFLHGLRNTSWAWSSHGSTPGRGLRVYRGWHLFDESD